MRLSGCGAQVVLQRAHNAGEISKQVTQHGAQLADRGLRSLGIARAAGESGGEHRTLKTPRVTPE